METRNTVVSVRLDDPSMQAVDLLVRAGLAQSRSEATARLVAMGVAAAGDLLQRAEGLAENLRQVRQEMETAVKSRDLARVAALLDEKPELMAAPAEGGETLILMAVYNGAREVAELLLARGAELNLWEAAAVGNTERVRQLLKAEPELLTAYSQDGWTALHLACFFGHEEAGAHLLELGADVRARSRNGMGNTPLHAAMAGRALGLARRLVAAGADVGARDSAGWVPLHHAAYSGDLEMAELFIARGVDVNIPNNKGQRALALAVQRGHDAVAGLLRGHGATE